MKNIVYIGGFELPDKNAAALRVTSNGKIFNELGFNVIYIGVDKNLKKIDNFKEDYRNNSFVFCYPYNIYSWFKYLTDSEKHIKVLNNLNNVEYLICYNLPSLILRKLILYGKKTSIKVVTDTTEWYGFQGKNFFWKIIKGIDSLYRMRFLNKKVDGNIVISNFLLDYYNSKVNSILIPPLVDLSEKKWENISVNKENIFDFIYSGSPGKKDEIKLLVELFSKYRYGINLHIVGISEEDFINEYNSNVYKKRINIIFYGRVTHNKSLELIKKSDYSIFFRKHKLSNNAGFPTKLVESISLGVPVITNKTSNIADFIINGYNGILVDSLDLNDIDSEIKNIVRNKIYLKGKFDRSIFNYNKYIDKVKIYLKSIKK